MTFLPIVARELRVASRRRWTYWGRFSAALLALLASGVVLLLVDSSDQKETGLALVPRPGPADLLLRRHRGHATDLRLLDWERREEPSACSSLTDLRGYDIVFGKLAATSLHAFYSILSLLPVLAVPLLLGGVASAEVWRVALVAARPPFP